MSKELRNKNDKTLSNKERTLSAAAMPTTPSIILADTSTMERLKDTQGLTDCISAHTLIEVGERHEAIDFCKSVLRQPSKTLTGLQTQAYLTILVGCIDDKADLEGQIKKAKKLWYRIKSKHDNAYGVSGETREISKNNTDKKWKGVMDSLDDTEVHFKEEIKAAKLPLENRIAILENELLVAQGKITLLQDQSIAKQEKIDILQAEVALLKSKPSSEYTQSSVIKPEVPPRWNMPWPLSLCLSTHPDRDDFDTTIEDNRYAHTQRPSMIIDNNRYSTAAQVMSNKQKAQGSASDTSAQAAISDLDRLMMNGPILVRPGKPLAYVDDNGKIVEVDCDINDLPPMMFPHGRMHQGASSASLAAGRHMSTKF